MTQNNVFSRQNDNLIGSMFSKRGGKTIGCVFALMLIPAVLGFDMTYKAVFPMYIGFWQNTLICSVADLVLSVILYLLTRKNIFSIICFNILISFIVVGCAYLGIVTLNDLGSTDKQHEADTNITYVDLHTSTKSRTYDAHYIFPENNVHCYWPMGHEQTFAPGDPCTIVYHMGNLGLYVIDDVKHRDKKSN